jgi:hypothetical protein
VDKGFGGRDERKIELENGKREYGTGTSTPTTRYIPILTQSPWKSPKGPQPIHDTFLQDQELNNSISPLILTNTLNNYFLLILSHKTNDDQHS